MHPYILYLCIGIKSDDKTRLPYEQCLVVINSSRWFTSSFVRASELKQFDVAEGRSRSSS